MYATNEPLSSTDRKLLRSQPRRNAKKWGEIQNDRAVIRASCRRCGTYGTFKDPQDAKVFEDYHNGVTTAGKCPLEDAQRY